MRLVNLTVVFSLFLSTLNVSSMNIPLSFSKSQEISVYQESAEAQHEFEEHELLSEPGFINGLTETPFLHKVLP